MAERLRALLEKAVGDTPLVHELPRYLSGAPEWLDPDAETWNIAQLHHQSDKKTWTLDFRRLTHQELRAVARAHALWQIVEQQVSPTSLTGALNVFVYLADQLAARPLALLKTEDFHAAEHDISSNYAPGTSARMCADLQRICAWLDRHVGLRLEYTSTLRAPTEHGRAATDEGRDAKLLPDSVVADLLSARHDPNLSKRDRFYLAVIAISVATGFRLAELLTLPDDCLIEDQGALLVRSFVSKHGKAAPRPVVPELAEMVVDAVKYLRKVTRPAREQARAWTVNPPIIWVSIVRDSDPDAFEYFLRHWLADWIANPSNRMIDSRWAYFSRGDQSKWIPLASLLEKHEGNISAISRELGMARVSVAKLIKQLDASRRGAVYLGNKNPSSRRAFDTDRRFPSITAFGKLRKL